MKIIQKLGTRKIQRKLWLFASPVFLLALLFAVNSSRHRCQTEIEISVPFYPDTDLRESIAIKEISSAIKRCPHTSIYIVHMPGNNVYADGLLTYDRQKQRLTRRDIQPMGNGTTSWWNNVRDAAISKAATKSAHFNDMGAYGCKPMF